MRTLAVVLSTVLLTLVLAACATAALTQGEVGGSVESKWIRLPDKSRVVCVVYDGNRNGGITCDWPHHE